MRSGVDSAFGPTPEEARTAMAQGVEWWAFYKAGPRAYRNWSAAEVNVLRGVGFTACMPIFVPDLGGDPVADARAFVSAYRAERVAGAGALDTEAYMRNDARLKPYADAFCAEMMRLGEKPVVYAGGNYVPNGAWPWYIWPGNPPVSECRQTGTATIDGLTVDTDIAAEGFPLAALSPGRAPETGADDVIAAWGADTDTDAQRIVDYRRGQVRTWFIYYRHENEITVQQQQLAVTYWAQHGGDATLAGIIDGTLG